MKNLKMAMLGAAAFTAVMSGGAQAGVSTGTMPVTATILENCTVVATPMVFAPTIQVGSSDIDSTATINLACTPNADFDVALNNGTHSVSSARNLKLSTGAELLPYEIYLDSARTQIWGNNAGVDTKAGTAPQGVASMTAYGRIAASTPAASAGVYSDTVTVTVTF